MKDYEIFIDLGIPGWINQKDIISICKFIHSYNPKSILEPGPFGGRLTASICKTFPGILVTAVDAFIFRNQKLLPELLLKEGWYTFDKKYYGYNLNIEFFKEIHNYLNLTLIEKNFLNYNSRHDLTVFSITPDKLPLPVPEAFNNSEFSNYSPTLIKFMDHALECSNTVIGNFKSLGSKEDDWYRELINNYNLEVFDGCYRVINKK